MGKSKRKSNWIGEEDEEVYDRRKNQDRDRRKAKKMKNALRVKDIDSLLELDED